MFRFLLILAACCAILPSVLLNSAGAASNVCTNNLTIEHGVEGQNSTPPYHIVAGYEDKVYVGSPLAVQLVGNDTFQGFVMQARDSNNKPIGIFGISDTNTQSLSCLNENDTVTHTKLPTSGINMIETVWVTYKRYTGPVTFIATVAKNGGIFWNRMVNKTINVDFFKNVY